MFMLSERGNSLDDFRMDLMQACVILCGPKAFRAVNFVIGFPGKYHKDQRCIWSFMNALV